ncbi:HAD-IA family hydrolase [Oceanobacter antarcticus]|mgnify:CR=1 FL=1|jgi:phosphoglycolate phosphatase|uniref:HAD-IA family hydrolase n=1 Tax=Oceanobacter antarcticus TaxID=3133425 RepID=A0ABW8NGP0_9GAMM
MGFDLIIFDWDGTLADSTGRIVDSMQRAGRIVGLPLVTDAQVQNIIGLGLPEAVETLWPAIDEEQMAAMKECYARHFVSDSPIPMGLFAGAETMLARLQERGVLLAVATGKSRRGLDRILDDLTLRHRFAATRCADESRSKPDPLMLQELLAQLRIPASRALMVGDTTYDLDMANAAGVAGVAMSHGAHDELALLGCRPLAMCHSIAELDVWIAQAL